MQRVVYRDEVPYTSSTRHVVVKSDFIDGTEEVIYSGSDHDASAYVDLPDASVPMTSDVSYNNEVDFDHHAVINDDVTFADDDDMDAACLPDAVSYSAPAIVRSRAVSYVPIDHVDDPFYVEDDVAYIATDDSAHPPLQYVSSVDDADMVVAKTAFIEHGDAEETCVSAAVVRECDDDMDLDPVSYVPVDDVDYVYPVTVSNVPVEEIRYTQVNSADDIVFDNDCDTLVTNLDGEPVSFTDTSDVALDVDETDVVAVNDVEHDVYDDPYADDLDAEFDADVGLA
jgi:hypothetical protein